MKTELEEWVEWLNSDEGKRAVDSTTLGPAKAANEYLTNRFARVFGYAFSKGVVAGREQAKQRLVKVIDCN